MRAADVIKFCTVAALLWISASACYLQAQNIRAEDDEQDGNAVVASDSFETQLISPAGNAVEYLSGDVLVVRVSAKSEASIRSASVRLTGEAYRLFEAKKCNVAGQEKSEGGDELELKPGDELIVDCIVTPSKGFGNTFAAIISTAKPAQAIVLLEKAEGTSSLWESESIAFRTEPASISPILGAIVGSLLFALLLAIDRRRLEWKEVLLQVAGAAIIAVILIFALTLFSGDGAIAMPIRVEITDFQGGVIVGLVAHLLRKQILEKLAAKSG